MLTRHAPWRWLLQRLPGLSRPACTPATGASASCCVDPGAWEPPAWGLAPSAVVGGAGGTGGARQLHASACAAARRTHKPARADTRRNDSDAYERGLPALIVKQILSKSHRGRQPQAPTPEDVYQPRAASAGGGTEPHSPPQRARSRSTAAPAMTASAAGHERPARDQSVLRREARAERQQHRPGSSPRALPAAVAPDGAVKSTGNTTTDEVVPHRGPVTFDVLHDEPAPTSVPRPSAAKQAGKAPKRDAAGFAVGLPAEARLRGADSSEEAWGYISVQHAGRFQIALPANADVDNAVSRDVTMRVASCDTYDKIVPLLEGRLQRLDSTALSLVLYRLTRLHATATGEAQAQIGALALDALCRLETQVAGMTGRCAAAVMYTMAKLKQRPPHLLPLLSLHLQQARVMNALNERDAVDVLWALATMQVQLPPATLRLLCRGLMAKGDTLQGRLVSISVWALGKLRFHPGRDVMNALLKACERSHRTDPEGWNAQNVTNLLRGLRALSFRPTDAVLRLTTQHFATNFDHYVPTAVVSSFQALAHFGAAPDEAALKMLKRGVRERAASFGPERAQAVEVALKALHGGDTCVPF